MKPWTTKSGKIDGSFSKDCTVWRINSSPVGSCFNNLADCLKDCKEDGIFISYLKNPMTIGIAFGVVIIAMFITYMTNKGMFIMFAGIFIIMLGFLGYYLITSAVNKFKSTTFGKLVT